MTKKKCATIEEFFGAWPGGTEELTNIKKILDEDRKKFKLSEVRL